MIAVLKTRQVTEKAEALRLFDEEILEGLAFVKIFGAHGIIDVKGGINAKDYLCGTVNVEEFFQCVHSAAINNAHLRLVKEQQNILFCLVKLWLEGFDLGGHIIIIDHEIAFVIEVAHHVFGNEVFLRHLRGHRIDAAVTVNVEGIVKAVDVRYHAAAAFEAADIARFGIEDLSLVVNFEFIVQVAVCEKAFARFL